MNRVKSNSFFKIQLLTIALIATLGLSACATDRQLRGHVANYVQYDGMMVGFDNVNSVEFALGRPSMTGTFNDNIWYYISTATINRSIYKEKPFAHLVYAVEFDEKGIVKDIKRYSLNDMQEVHPVNDTTPTRGREFGFFEQIFGNIGRFAAPTPGT